jgi:hypothetical protein
MKVSGAHIELQGRPVRRNDGALVRNDERDMVLLEPTREMYPEGHPQGERPDFRDSSPEASDWRKKWQAWRERAFLSDGYARAVGELIEKQKSEPWWPRNYGCCIYQDKIYYVEAPGLDPTERSLLVKHFALRQQLTFKRISKEIQAFENLERMTHREVIPESVRIFVWQRDGGKCVECGRRDSLEFDHIIPLADGGASTERNVQLRCTPCNQRKGKNV